MIDVPKRLLALLLALAGAWSASGCVSTHPWREVERPWTAKSFEEVERARLERDDGWTFELEAPRWVELPEGPALAGRLAGEAREAQVPLATIVRIQAPRFEGQAVVANVTTWTMIVLVFVILVVAASTVEVAYTIGA